MMKRRRFLKIVAGCAGATLARAGAARAESWQGVAFGSDVQVTIAGARTKAVLARLPSFLDHFEDQFSLYRPESAINRLNAAGRLDRPHPDMLRLLCLADRVHRMTNGLFDPTVQPLWRALAQGGDVLAAEQAIGWGRVTVHDDVVLLDRGQALTLNGIAQGYAAERLRLWLQMEGFDEVLVDCGEYATSGGPWPVAIADPQGGILGKRTLQNGTLAVSSPGALMVGGRPHILGPRGERPVWSTVAVEAGDAGLADGLSTAMVFLGRDALAAAMRDFDEIEAVTLVDHEGNLETIMG
jgi:thiamine biosynthesis lipoprotein